MQFEKKDDLNYIASSHCEHDFKYAAVVNERGEEVEITQEMIDHLYESLCAEQQIRHTLMS